MTKYEHLQKQIDDIINMQLQIYKKCGRESDINLLEKVKWNIRNKQLNLTIENSGKKANFIYRIFN